MNETENNATTAPVAFFCRAKPQGADAFEIFKEAKRVFIGYPLWRHDADYNPHALHSCLVDPSCPDEEWNSEVAHQKRSNRFTQNRNLVRWITPGSIVVIPRPEHGAVYLGLIDGDFEVVDSPSWAKAYLKLRKDQGLDTDDKENGHVGDVAQGWPVDRYRCVSLARVPGWLRRSMFGRSTYGYFSDHPLDPNITAYAVFDQLLSQGKGEPLTWTLDPEEIKRRLVDTLTANAFEHLVVSLLQLEHPNEIWQQTGGPGDGGIDGLGSDETGEVVGVMQAKFSAARAPALSDLGHKSKIRRYAAVLMPGKPVPPNDGTELLDIDWVAEKIGQHWLRLPQALAMRIGEVEASALSSTPRPSGSFAER